MDYISYAKTSLHYHLPFDQTQHLFSGHLGLETQGYVVCQANSDVPFFSSLFASVFLLQAKNHKTKVSETDYIVHDFMGFVITKFNR